MLFFLRLSTWRRQPYWSPSNKKLSSRQTATLTQNWNREKNYKKKERKLNDTKGKKEDTKIKWVLGGGSTSTDPPAGGEGWRQTDGETEVKRPGRGFGHPFASCGGEEGGWLISQATELHMDRRQSGACGRRRGLPPGGQDWRPGVGLLPRWAGGHSAGFNPRWLERHICSDFFHFFLIF